MADYASLSNRFESACSYALQKFGLAIKELILERDSFVILPTGSGKSSIFQAFPLVLDHFEGSQSAHQSFAGAVVIHDFHNSRRRGGLVMTFCM